MKAFVKTKKGPGNVGVMEKEDPHLTEDGLLIQIVAAGVCHSDLLMIDWGPTVEEEYRPPLPLVMGHEFSGRVMKTGPFV